MSPRTALASARRGVCSLANYSVTYEETQSNRVSDPGYFENRIPLRPTLGGWGGGGRRMKPRKLHCYI